MMYSLLQCPRCGGQRLVKPSAQCILLVCPSCGLLATEPELPPPPTVTLQEAAWNPVRHQRNWGSRASGSLPIWPENRCD